MSIVPSFTDVDGLFRNCQRFVIPKYQRSYAWTLEEIKDFLHDLDKCYKLRSVNERNEHFFGGVVSVQQMSPDSAGSNFYDIVDGQQRLVTFTIFMACLMQAYQDISKSVREDDPNRKVLNGRIDRIANSFIEYTEEVNREYVPVSRIKLSENDHDFFRALVFRDTSSTAITSSQENLSEAFKSIRRYVKKIVSSQDTLIEKLGALENLENVVKRDFTLIHIRTDTRDEAYRLFQVLNDRGLTLSEGDLLRASTLEVLDRPLFKPLFSQAEKAWNDILIQPPKEIEENLRWIFASYMGKRPSKAGLLDEFKKAFFPQILASPINQTEAGLVTQSIVRLREEFEKCRVVSGGDWPYASTNNSITIRRSRETLKTLINELKHTAVIPFLIAASKLDELKFASIVDITSRFFFRYKVLYKNHQGDLADLYQTEAVKIRSDPNAYRVESYVDAVKVLQSASTPEASFDISVDRAMVYKENSNNKELKFFLLTLEEYMRWYDEGRTGRPRILDSSTITIFNSNTIEHVYPQSPQDGFEDKELNEMKHTLGNLTILGPNDNSEASNKKFEDKKAYLSNSSIRMNRDVFNKSQWTKQELEERRTKLIDLAKKIFLIQ